jgi:CO/xanthine dehydrogenase FAD-binding subunit
MAARGDHQFDLSLTLCFYSAVLELRSSEGWARIAVSGFFYGRGA